MASRVLGAFVVAGTTVLASLALATPASAHTPAVKVDCDEAGQKSVLTVELRDYNTRKGQNKLTVVIDGAEVKNVSFDNNVPKETWSRDSKTEHTYKVTVTASDDPNGLQDNPNWSRVFDLSNEKCVKPEAPKPSEPTQSTPPSEAPSSSEVPPPATTPNAPAPGGSTPEPPLAATGASPMWLLLSGLGLVGAGAGTLLFLRRRRA